MDLDDGGTSVGKSLSLKGGLGPTSHENYSEGSRYEYPIGLPMS